ncbi:hypothetical protein NL676_003157 [Syzygium grande]|nr:hypothetical protein NL676_003157 [Syzygium grande]
MKNTGTVLRGVKKRAGRVKPTKEATALVSAPLRPRPASIDGRAVGAIWAVRSGYFLDRRKGTFVPKKMTWNRAAAGGNGFPTRVARGGDDPLTRRHVTRVANLPRKFATDILRPQEKPARLDQSSRTQTFARCS